jgi:hypothetical protein
VLPLFNTLAAQVIVLVFIAVTLAAPFLALWFCLSIRRDISRIANAIEIQAEATPTPAGFELFKSRLTPEIAQRRVANSMFGR